MKDSRLDDWRGVEDPRERKQIQDRLAQRARRKRLREAKEAIIRKGKSPSSATTEQGLSCWDWASTPCSLDSTSTINLPSSSGQIATTELSTVSSSGSDMFSASNIALFPNMLIAQPPAPLTVFSAMFINGKILGLTCSTTLPGKSKVQPPEVPVPLQPTPTQLLNYHSLFIDRFPFTNMRDAMINMSSIIDDEEFLEDLFTMDSFTIAPGCASWDPRSWKLVKGRFAEKWGYLIC